MYCDAIPHNPSCSEAEPSCGPADQRFNVHCSSQDSCPPYAWADWETIAPLLPGMMIPLSQEVLEGAGVFTFSTHTPHSDTHLGEDLLLTTHEFVYQYMGRLPPPYPSGQTKNTRIDNIPLGLLGGMDRPSVSEMLYKDRPRPEPPMLASAFLDHEAWSGPRHTPSTLDHPDRGSLSNHLERVPSRRLAKSTPVNGKTTLGSQTADVSPTVAYEIDVSTASPLLLFVPISWREIPQQQYTPRTRDRSFLRLRRVTFSVNGVPGINMQRALNRVFVGLDNRDDSVLENANGPVSCRLLFPGYPTNTRCNQIAVRNWKKPPAPIMRSKLAYEIAKHVNQYMNTSSAIPMDSSTDPQWKIGQGCMKLEKMYLVSVSWVSKGSVQPEIWVDADDP